jgi:hypothetical protein
MFQRNAAWDERFDHIDNHFSKEGMKIGAWLCVEGKKTKGEVLKESDKDSFDEDDIESFTPEDEQGSPEAAQWDDPEPSPDTQATTSSLSDPASPHPPKKRPAESMSVDAYQPASKKFKSEISKYCVSTVI